MKTPKITSIIKGAAARSDLTSKALARETGIPYQTLRYRFKNPTSWRFYEWRAILRHVEFSEEELNNIRAEVRK